MDINRFTEKSREALTTAQGLAAQYGHQEVDAEHLALAARITCTPNTTTHMPRTSHVSVFES